MRYALNETISIQAIFEDQFKVPITTATGKLTIRRLSDDKYFDGVSTWSATLVLIDMVKVSDANAPGWWRFLFNTTGMAKETFITTVTDGSANAKNVPQQGELITGGWPQDILDLLAVIDGKVDTIDTNAAAILLDTDRILALSQDNFVFDPTVYDSKGRMLEGEKRLYDSAANSSTDDGVTGLKYKYAIVSVRTLLGYLGKYTSTRIT